MAVQTQPVATGNQTSRRRRPHIDWLRIILIALFIGYWLFMTAMERIDSRPLLARFFFPELSPIQVAALTFPPWLMTLIEMFYPRVLRHLIPVFIGWWLAMEAATSLIQVFYHCPDRKTARDFLKRQRRNRAGAEIPLEIKPQTLAALRENSVLLRAGGPVLINVPDGHAAVTERNARFRRVLSPGTHELGRFEYPVAVIELLPNEQFARDIPLITNDGIPLTTDASILFRIDPGTDRTHLEPLPYSDDAVRRAAYSGVVAASGKVSSWVDGPIGKVKGALATHVAREPLDKLIFDESRRQVQRDLSQAVIADVWDKLAKEGIKPLQLRIGRLAPPEAVSRQFTEYWLANQQKGDMIARANGTAQLVQEAEVARAEAEIAMLQAIVEGVRRAQNEAGSRLTGYLLALRLLESLRRMVRYSSQDLAESSSETGDMLQQIDGLAERLATLEKQIKPPAPDDPPGLPQAG
jgi:regulator of protease activity HflC (stomatin/prohibitin superfamily)